MMGEGFYDLDYLGSLNQVAFLQECRLSGGRAEGVRAVIVHAGNGLEFMVLLDRGMDIPYLYYKGQGVHFSSATGIVHPAYYESYGNEWLRGFFAGALTTCGITFAGQSEDDSGEHYGLHGRVSHIPADQVRCYENYHHGSAMLRIEGTLRDVKALGTHVELQRVITTESSSSSFTLVDHIRNCGSKPVPLMMLYHINFGYPLLNQNARIYGSFVSTSGITPLSRRAEEIASCRTFCEPQDMYEERVFFHQWKDMPGRRTVGILQDPDRDDHVLGVVLEYDGDVLPDLVQWKMMQRRDYVLGLEPCTVVPVGRKNLRELGKLPMLEPDEVKRIAITYYVTETRKDFETHMT